jgi:hypothetical protein
MHRATAQVEEVMFQGLSVAWANVGPGVLDVIARPGSHRRQQ